MVLTVVLEYSFLISCECCISQFSRRSIYVYAVWRGIDYECMSFYFLGASFFFCSSFFCSSFFCSSFFCSSFFCSSFFCSSFFCSSFLFFSLWNIKQVYRHTITSIGHNIRERIDVMGYSCCCRIQSFWLCVKEIECL